MSPPTLCGWFHLLRGLGEMVLQHSRGYQPRRRGFVAVLEALERTQSEQQSNAGANERAEGVGAQADGSQVAVANGASESCKKPEGIRS